MQKSEYLPNAWEETGKTYYVSKHNIQASDENPGTKERPFKTISKAASIMDMGDTARIDEGIYREEVKIYKNGHIYEPRLLPSFKAVLGAKVYLKGSDVFEPKWDRVGGDVYKAPLPESLFAQGAYNPYELSLVEDEHEIRVRPSKGEILPPTLGQIYFDDEPLEEAGGMEALLKITGSFIVAPDGKEIFVHCKDGRKPDDSCVELTVRKHCFKPMFPGALYIQTMGMVITHAAEPGAFEYCRPCSIRKNTNSGITVCKTYNLPGTSETDCGLFGDISYISKNKQSLIASVIDDTKPRPLDKTIINEVISEDTGKVWKKLGDPHAVSQKPGYGYFLDREHGILLRHYHKMLKGCDLDCSSEPEHITMLEISKDEGKTWGSPQKINSNGWHQRIIKLKDGSLFWPSYEFVKINVKNHARVRTFLGSWNKDLTLINWEEGGMLEMDPQKSMGGLAEPHACQFPDGRLFVALRQGAMLASQDHPGVTSCKLFSVSEDKGKTWCAPRPLTYEDGRYVYSPRSYQDVFLSSKNGRPYIILNISDEPAFNCDPRTSLHIAEIDMQSLCLKRNTVTVIETKHEQHQSNIRFSNWQMIEDHQSGNLLLFMKLHTSQHGPVHSGYDCNSYRYEIMLPD